MTEVYHIAHKVLKLAFSKTAIAVVPHTLKPPYEVSSHDGMTMRSASATTCVVR